MAQILNPESRPDRKFLWTRFKHPLTKEMLRVDLGCDRDEAMLICGDLTQILSMTESWTDRNNPALDGLHPKAIEAFFEPLMRMLEHNLYKLQCESTQLALKSVGLQIDIVLVVIAKILEFNPRKIEGGGLSKDILASFGAKDPIKDSVVPEMPSAMRFTCPDGSVVYVGFEDHARISKVLARTFGPNTCRSDHVYLTRPDRRFIPELKALHTSSTGAFEVPENLSLPLKRTKLIYRFACPDDQIHFADGCTAYDHLYKILRAKYKIAKCEILAHPAERIPANWIEELKRLHGTAEGGYSIPFPDEPPKRRRRQRVQGGPDDSSTAKESRGK